MIKVTNFETGQFSWIIKVGPTKSPGFLKAGNISLLRIKVKYNYGKSNEAGGKIAGFQVEDMQVASRSWKYCPNFDFQPVRFMADF